MANIADIIKYEGDNSTFILPQHFDDEGKDLHGADHASQCH